MTNPNDNQMQDDLHYIMGDHRGRRFIWALLGLCGKGNTGFVIGAPDATAFNLGQINIGLQVEALCDLSQYSTMIQEATEKDNDRPEQSDDTPSS